jgi:hypothetical protein
VRGVFLIYLEGMSLIIRIDDNASAESTDLVLDFVEAMVEEGYETNDLVVAMLCAASAIMEAQAMDKEGMI